MNVIADVCIVPIGVGTSVAEEIALCQRVFTDAGLNIHLHAYGTNLEGEWDVVFSAIKHCHELLHSHGIARLSTSIKVGTRTDKPQTMRDKVQRVQRILESEPPPAPSQPNPSAS